MKIGNELSRYIEIKRVRQGGVLSMDLASLYSEISIKEVSEMESISIT